MDSYLTKRVGTPRLVPLVDRIATGAEARGGEGFRSVPDAASREVAFDRAEFMLRVAGDRDLAVELVEIFRGEAPSRMEEIRRSLEACDAQGVQRAAHALHGSVSLFSAAAAARAALAMELMGAGGDLSEGGKRWSELQSEVARLERDLTLL